MNPIKTVTDYLTMSSGDKKKFVKVVLTKANKDQADLVDRYNAAVKNGEIKPIN